MWRRRKGLTASMSSFTGDKIILVWNKLCKSSPCREGFPVTSIHGDRTQREREEALRRWSPPSRYVLLISAQVQSWPDTNHCGNCGSRAGPRHSQREARDQLRHAWRRWGVRPQVSKVYNVFFCWLAEHSPLQCFKCVQGFYFAKYYFCRFTRLLGRYFESILLQRHVLELFSVFRLSSPFNL